MSRLFTTVMNKTLPSKSPTGELHSNKHPVRMRKMQVEVKYTAILNEEIIWLAITITCHFRFF